jgi:hypothetical protein
VVEIGQVCVYLDGGRSYVYATPSGLAELWRVERMTKGYWADGDDVAVEG